MANSNLAEIEIQDQLISRWQEFGRVEKLTEVKAGDRQLPVYGFVLGPDDKTLPTFGLFAGVHGLERVGSHVVLNFMAPLIEQLKWDESLKDIFKKMRLVSIPIINPGGMYLNSRSNPQGVDIMRNAPIEAQGNLKPLVSGHRISPLLPWYRGLAGAEMEVETQTLIQFITREMLSSQFAMALDVHSGFGMRDRLWFPFSRSHENFPYRSTVDQVSTLLKQVYPHHVYIVEPQHQSYLLHGDPWDYIFDEHQKLSAGTDKMFIPWCLEMGSWSWLKKNPIQLFTRQGIFNPILPHRYSRIMRRHRPLLDFFRQATLNHNLWRAQMTNNDLTSKIKTAAVGATA